MSQKRSASKNGTESHVRSWEARARQKTRGEVMEDQIEPDCVLDKSRECEAGSGNLTKRQTLAREKS